MTNKWYAVDKAGIATLCKDEQDAIATAKESAILYPANAPYRAVQLVDAPKWLPIEIAPKDGAAILVTSSEGVYQAAFNDSSQSFEPITLDWHGCGCCGGYNPPTPLGWMPLPPPPETTS